MLGKKGPTLSSVIYFMTLYQYCICINTALAKTRYLRTIPGRSYRKAKLLTSSAQFCFPVRALLFYNTQRQISLQSGKDVHFIFMVMFCQTV